MYKFNLDKHDKTSPCFLSYVISEIRLDEDYKGDYIQVWTFIADKYDVKSRPVYPYKNANEQELKMNYDLTEEKLNKYIALYLLTKND